MFNYMYDIHYGCLGKNQELSDECANMVMKNLGIDVAAVDLCIDTSFAVKGDWSSYNQMLAIDQNFAQVNSIQLNPSLLINSQPYRGPMRGEDIFSEICSAYKPGH